MKKVFIVTGEASGDQLGAWYVHRLRQQYPDVYIEAVGGMRLRGSGARMYANIKKLGFVGVVEIAWHLPFILRFLAQLARHIATQQFDEVVLIDFPGFNLRLARALKKQAPHITITYFSPPQLWVWGAWRLKKIKRYCDRVIVLYPFEVDWYAARGVSVEFLGHPLSEELHDYTVHPRKKQHKVAILPGSRSVELKAFLPLFVDVMNKLKMVYPSITFVLPVAEGWSVRDIKMRIQQIGCRMWLKDIEFVRNRPDKLEALSQCVAAVAKPGTATLELALLTVPTVIAYKTSRLTYMMARPLVNVSWMGIANIMAGKEICPEFIQGDCTPNRITRAVRNILNDFEVTPGAYQKRLDELAVVHRMLKKE